MRKVLYGAAGLALIGAVLFMIAGTLAWPNGWIFLALMAALAPMTAHAINRSPGLVEERRNAARTAEPWDRAVLKLINGATIVVVVLAAWDQRVGWLPRVSIPISLAAFVLVLAATIVTYSAISANAFFSSFVRIQADRGHVVVSTGPYRFVRHPGYAGSVLFNLLLPLMLGSWLALAPAVCIAGLLIWRTAREDRFLKANLRGYATNAAQVRYRIVPGIW